MSSIKMEVGSLVVSISYCHATGPEFNSGPGQGSLNLDKMSITLAWKLNTEDHALN